jgi:hypothetical protein
LQVVAVVALQTLAAAADLVRVQVLLVITQVAQDKLAQVVAVEVEAHILQELALLVHY